MMKNKVLELSSVSKHYYRGLFRKSIVRAVNEVNLSINRGEIRSIVGESGSGKTTVGKISSGLIMPTSGSVKWLDQIVIKDGEIVNDKFFRQNRHRFVYIHQDPYSALNPSMNVYTTLDVVIKKHYPHMSASDRYDYIKRLLEKVGLSPPSYFLNKYPHHLSGGMKQRLVIARTLAVEPYLIVADEVVSMVDPSIRVAIINLLKEISEEYKTSIIFISHDLGAALYAAGDDGYVYVMLKGYIVEAGKVSKVMYDPKHPYTRALIANIPAVIRFDSGKRVRPPELVRIYDSESRIIRSICPFADLCPYADEECVSLKTLDYKEVSNDHLSLCVKSEKLPQWRPSWLKNI